MNNDLNWNWIFKGFLSQRRNTIQIWYDAQTEDVQNDFSFLIKTLRTRSPEEWGNMKMSKILRPPFKPLTELRFETNRIPYRPVGFSGVGRQTFTILTVATKQNFDRECKRALQRLSLVQQDPGEYSNESDCLSDITRKA